MARSIQGPEWRIILVGRRRSGKSVTGNTILGSEVFQSGIPWKAETQTCQKEEAQLKGRKIVVVDTPGFFDAHCSVWDIATKVSKWMKFCSPGPHVILHVMRPFRFSQEETYVAQHIKYVFGLKAKDYVIVLFTHKDDLEDESLEHFIFSKDEKLKEYIAECGNRYLAFENMAEGAKQKAQVAKLMTMIGDLVRKNRDAPYYIEDMMNVSKRVFFPFHKRPESLSN